MEALWQVDWKAVFLPSVSLVEIILRGTLIYFFLFFILRILRREAGMVGISDLLLVVLIADASQNAMAADAKSVTEGALLVATIAGWDFVLDYLGYRFPAIERLLRPAPLPLIQNGRMLRRNMRQELMTEEELIEQLRKQGVERVEEVKQCYMEGDGQLSVIKKKAETDQSKKQERKGI